MIDVSRLGDKEYRLNNLYNIVDKNGHNIRFLMNEAQRDVFHSLHNKNLILKARQLGMSTFCILYLLDEVIFNYNLSAGIVSYSLPHAQHIFKNIVGHALSNLPRELPDVGILSKSTKEITFSNGSDFRVDTSLRGGTTQLVLITEYGKTCARSPVRSEEIIAGTLESVPNNGLVLIESTGEGTSGAFTDMCLNASARGNSNLSVFDYKLHFYPWFSDTAYRLEDSSIVLDCATTDYFNRIETELDLTFTKEQKNWYYKKSQVLNMKMQQEYPSTVKESFVSNSDAFYFAKGLQDARNDDRIVAHDLYDSLLPVYVSADIAVTDYTVLTFFQLHHGEIRIIDWYADTNKDLEFYVRLMLKDKEYIYDTIFLPHDSVKKGAVVVENSYLNEMRKLMSHTGTRVLVLERMDRNASIGHAANAIRKCVFSERKCKDYIVHLSKYRKKWSEQLSRYLDEPLHDIHSDYADSFRYCTQAVARIAKIGVATNALSQHREVVANRAQRL